MSVDWTEGDWLTQACVDAVEDIRDMYDQARERLGLTDEDPS